MTRFFVDPHCVERMKERGAKDVDKILKQALEEGVLLFQEGVELLIYSHPWYFPIRANGGKTYEVKTGMPWLPFKYWGRGLEPKDLPWNDSSKVDNIELIYSIL